MSLSTVINYNNEANFAFDNKLVEFAGDKVQLKNQINANETLFHNFATKDILRAAGGSLI